MAKAQREVLLVGSVPLTSASAVFETVAKHLGPLVSRIPDGEQIGWSAAVVRTVERNEAFEVSRRVPLNAGGRDPIRIFRLRDGHSADKLKLGPYGYAANAAESYAAFKRLREQGVIHASTRYQVTLPGPGTSTFFLERPTARDRGNGADHSSQRSHDPARHRHGSGARGVPSEAAGFRSTAA